MKQCQHKDYWEGIGLIERNENWKARNGVSYKALVYVFDFYGILLNNERLISIYSL